MILAVQSGAAAASILFAAMSISTAEPASRSPPIEQSDEPSSPLIEQSELQGAWHCELPLAQGQLYRRSVDIELRKYAVHDNAYIIRGEFPVWGNGESLSLNYTDDMEVVYFNGKPCQQIKNGQ
jgi:hypothetical protein